LRTQIGGANVALNRFVYLKPIEGDPIEGSGMHFRLTYQGPLRPTQPQDKCRPEKESLAQHKHKVRRHFHEQLKDWWRFNRFLASYKADTLEDYSLSPVEQSGRWDDGPSVNALPLSELVARQYVENGFRFAPLVTERASLTCSLDILVLRRDHPANGVLSAGDLDNRVKTIVDCLTKPRGAGQLGGAVPQDGENPFFCLLEDDRLVTGLTVESDLLISSSSHKDGSDDFLREVELVVSVEVKPYHITMFNLGFA
jgi:hypothetical protein